MLIPRKKLIEWQIGGYDYAIYVDGSCAKGSHATLRNMGAGVKIINTRTYDVKTFAIPLGRSNNNNLAELLAIEEGLKRIPNKLETSVIVYSDSEFAIGFAKGVFKGKSTDQDVKRIRSIVQEFKCVLFQKVKGHTEIYGNTQADKLALEGAKKNETI